MSGRSEPRFLGDSCDAEGVEGRRRSRGTRGEFEPNAQQARACAYLNQYPLTLTAMILTCSLIMSLSLFHVTAMTLPRSLTTISRPVSF
jgi:hypothetical protein